MTFIDNSIAFYKSSSNVSDDDISTAAIAHVLNSKGEDLTDDNGDTLCIKINFTDDTHNYVIVSLNEDQVIYRHASELETKWLDNGADPNEPPV